MAMRATTDVKRVCRVERTFHHTCNAFKLPHGTHRRPVSRLVCRSVGRSVGRAVHSRRLCTFFRVLDEDAVFDFPLVIYTIRNEQSNGRIHATHAPACTHCTLDEGFPEEEKKEREEKRMKKSSRCCAALRRTAPRRETERYD